jgi:formylglycine-generating enzyme required for sulfatase activity/tetratricopeptide (TPR) repeat protein
LIAWGGIEGYGRLRASALVDSLQRVGTPEVPAIVRRLSGYRRWADPQLVRVVQSTDDQSREHLHASLALLPIDATQVDYLFSRLLTATSSEVPVLVDPLRLHRSTLTPKLWTTLESAKSGDVSLLSSASALASYDPENARWEAVGDKVAQALVSVNSLLLRPWIEALRPVRGKLTAPIATIFQDKSRSEGVHTLATDILTDYASDEPDRLAELLMVSDPKAYTSLFPVAEKKAEQVLPIFQAELRKEATYTWNDPPLDPSWTKPDADLVNRIEAAQGILKERFAFCQTIPLDEFLTTAEALRRSGYRPVRFRPYADGQVVRVAAVWTRDGRDWRISSGLTADEVRRLDERNKKDKLLPVDVAGYVAVDGGGKPTDRYTAIWVERTGDDAARMYVGRATDEEDEVQERLKVEKLIPRTLHAMMGADGRTRYCGVWGRLPGTAIMGLTYRDQFEAEFDHNQANLSDQLLLDLVVSGVSGQRTIRERAQAALEDADNRLKTRPDDLDPRFSRAVAYLHLGENRKALDNLNVVVRKNPESVPARQYRVVVLARLGKKQDALTELEKFQKEGRPEDEWLYLAPVVAAELGERVDKAFEALEAAIRKHPEKTMLRHNAACGFSLASKAISRSDKLKGRQLEERSLQLLRELVKDDDAELRRMDQDADLDPIRDDPAFAEIMRAGHPDRRYASAWSGETMCPWGADVSFEAIPLYGLDPTAHLWRCRELIAQGYRPVSWSVTRTTPEGPLVAASVWHRAVVQEETKDRLAERQARAAIALVRMDKAGEVWPLLRHSADPRLRSFLLNWLNPLGADPKSIAAEFDRIDPNAKPTPAPGQQRMDAILFQPETSQRRALILTLGTYGMAGLSPGEREPLTRKLFDLYRNDPVSGIHGAAEWTLRKWRQQEKLKEVDALLVKVKDWGDRRWFINGQGQTFVLIEGPVEFVMGSPPTETGRQAVMERPRRMRIPRRFAIAAKEVTVEQFQRFVKGIVFPMSPDQHGPWIGLDWYEAVAYCNWLSEQEGLAKDQWCYLPNQSGAYDEGMSIPADVLQRTGYRLPTETEWEYACRAGALTSRYYGNSIALIDTYAWYNANSKDRAWVCGSLLPNDLGLSDVLGNMYEWCQERLIYFLPGNKDSRDDMITTSETIVGKDHRCLRGGSFLYSAGTIRSAHRYSEPPASHYLWAGFRPARTYYNATTQPPVLACTPTQSGTIDPARQRRGRTGL